MEGESSPVERDEQSRSSETGARAAKAAEPMIYGLALAAAVIGGATAVLSALGEPAEEAPAEAMPQSGAEAPFARSGRRERGEATAEYRARGRRVSVDDPAKGRAAGATEEGRAKIGGRAADDGRGAPLAPDLPEVPDLANEPPPAREPGTRDPRFAQLGAEMRLLSRARDLLAEHPAEALGVLERHRRRHPAGALREEREAFAIEALVTLEHVREAERRYYEFLRDFPHSDFRGRLEELMQRPPHEVGALGR